MVLAVKISPEELLEDFDNTVLTQNQNVCITNLSRIYEYYINIHIQYQKTNGRTAQIETMGIINFRYKDVLKILRSWLKESCSRNHSR